MRAVVLCQSRDVEIAQDAGSFFNIGVKEKGEVGEKKGYIYSSSCDSLVQLVRYDIFDSYLAFCWLTKTDGISLHFTQLRGTSWTRSLETRYSSSAEDCSRCRALLLHHTLLSLPRPLASQIKLSSSQVVWTVQPSNMASNTPSGGQCTHHWCHKMRNLSFFAPRSLYLCHPGISTGKLKIYTIDCSRYCAKNECNTVMVAPRRHKHPLSGANSPSDVAVIVNINPKINLSSIWWHLTAWLNASQGILSLSIIMSDSDWKSSAVLTATALFSNPSWVTQIGVYLACGYI